MKHAEDDELIKGKYWQNGKGCAVGCTIHSGDHAQYEIELGIPRWLALVEDRIFEGLPDEKAKEWPTKFLSAIHIGADLEKVKAPFLIFVLESMLDKFDHGKYPGVKNGIDDSIALYKKEGATVEEFKAARADTASAAYGAAYAAYNSYCCCYSAYAAYNTIAAVTDAVAYATHGATDAAHARGNAYTEFSDKLLWLLGNCK